jgi:hypothetical protein
MVHVGRSAMDEDERSPYLLRLIVIAGVGATLLVLLVLQLVSHWRSRSEAPEPTPTEDSLTFPDTAPVAPVAPGEPAGGSLVEPPGAESVEESPSEASDEEPDNLLNPFIAPPME